MTTDRKPVTFAGLKARIRAKDWLSLRSAQEGFRTTRAKWIAEEMRDWCAGELESLEQRVRADIEELTAIANGLSHEQSEDPDQGMIPTISCAHCQLLLTAVPKLKELLGEPRGEEKGNASRRV